MSKFFPFLRGAAALGASIACASSVLAHDLNPSPFRGKPGSTYSAWDFVTAVQGAPDGPCPPQGAAGDFYSASPGAHYFPSFGGEQGVWCLVNPGDKLTFTKNCAPGGLPFWVKTVYVQMTLHFHSGSAGIDVEISPPGGPAFPSGPTIDLPIPGKGPFWVHRTQAFCVFSCPPQVIVSLVGTGLTPDDHVDVSEVVIETICEPDLCHEPKLPVFPGDYDGDGIKDEWDNAPGVANPNQSDCDDDGTGDVSDTCEICPPSAPPEPEPCGTDTNGGCNHPNGEVTQLDCNKEYCGTLWAEAGTRDTDWYEILLQDADGSGDEDLLVEVCTALPTLVFITDTTCPPVIFHVFDADLDRQGMATICLPAPAKYRIVLVTGTVSMDIFDGYPCGGLNNQYWLRAYCAEPCFVCGPPNPNSCCVGTTSPGCEDGSCCALVCAVDPFCCQTAWDAICANEARSICPEICCTADLNGDGLVNGADITILLGLWNVNFINVADLNGDCAVNGADLAILLGQWGPC